MQPRIEWGPDGNLVSLVPELLQLHAEGGELLRVISRKDELDARWLPDGNLIAIDAGGTERWYSTEATLLHVQPTHTQLAAVAIAGDGGSYIAVQQPIPRPANVRILAVSRTHAHSEPAPAQQVVVMIAGSRTWSLDPWMYGISRDAAGWSVAIAWDGSHVAVGYEVPVGAARESGRGWLVVSTETWKIVDRAWDAMTCEPGHMVFAFDREARRFAAASPERVPQVGALRVGSGEPHARSHLGGARAIAFDDRGLLAGFGYPAGIGLQRLRVDYLAPWQRGRPVVEVQDTLWIDPDLPDIVALAFHPANRRIACLASTGAVDVVPVP